MLPVCSRRQWLAWCGAASALTSTPTLAKPDPIRTALRVLLIGNSSYQHNAKLDNPVRDVALLAHTFRNRGAHVTQLLDATAPALLQGVSDFLQSSPRSDALWIGYSGHAVQLDGRNYLQGVDSRFDQLREVRAHGVNLDRLIRMVERHAPRAAVLSIDACRDNPFDPARTRSALTGLAVQEPQGLCISFSTAPYTRAYDGDAGQYSPYAHALAQALQAPPRKSLDEVLQQTANQVYAHTQQRQVPEYRSALRSQWWFEADRIALQPMAPQPRRPVGSHNARAGDNSYRPDQPPGTGQTPPQPQPQWDAKREQLLQRLLLMDERDIDKLLQQTHSQRSPDDTLSLALHFLERPFARRADTKIDDLVRPLAEQGNPLAQHLLAESAFAESNYGDAYKWFSLAARAGYSPAPLHDDAEQTVTMSEGRLFSWGSTADAPARMSPRMRLKKAMSGQR